MDQNYEVRLRRANVPEDCRIAFKWYQDPEVLYYSEGKGVEPYSPDVVQAMYEYLHSIGKLYIIEIKQNNQWIPIGDVTLAKETLPIVIGEKKYRSRGIGKQVLQFIIDEAKKENWDRLKVRKVFDYNERSHRLFTSLGFKVFSAGVDENGNHFKSYVLHLK